MELLWHVAFSCCHMSELKGRPKIMSCLLGTFLVPGAWKNRRRDRVVVTVATVIARRSPRCHVGSTRSIGFRQVAAPNRRHAPCAPLSASLEATARLLASAVLASSVVRTVK